MGAVHVAQLLKTAVGTTRRLELSGDEPVLEAELGFRGSLSASVKLTKTPHGILADCAYRGEIEEECGRCLELTRHEIGGRFSQEFLPSANTLAGVPQGLQADRDEPTIGPDHILDLTDVVRQDIVVNQAMQPLCRPDCRGLCTMCGANLNDMTCNCDNAAARPDELGRLGQLLRQRLARATE